MDILTCNADDMKVVTAKLGLSSDMSQDAISLGGTTQFKKAMGRSVLVVQGPIFVIDWIIAMVWIAGTSE